MKNEDSFTKSFSVKLSQPRLSEGYNRKFDQIEAQKNFSGFECLLGTGSEVSWKDQPS